MNLHLHRGDREAKCRWFNPPALCLGGSSLVLIKDPRSHIISCFSLHEDKKQSYLLSVTIIAVFKRVYFKNIRMNDTPSPLTPDVLKGDETGSVRGDDREIVRSSACTWTAGGAEEQDDETDLPAPKNITTGSSFPEIGYNYPVESSRVAPQVQIFVSLFRRKGEPSNLTTY